MIRLHRLGHREATFHLNPDLIVTVEATPDTVVTLTTGTRYVVAESPEAVAEAIRAWRGSILAAGTRGRRGSSANLVLVRGTAGDGAVAAIDDREDRR